MVDWALLLILEVPWATAPLTVVLGDLMFQMPVNLSRVTKTLVSGVPALILGQLIVRGTLLMCMVFYPLMPSQYAFLNEVILLERSSAFGQFKRSRTLSHGVEGELFMRWLFQLTLGATFAICFLMSLTTLGTALVGNDVTWYSPGLSDLSGLLFQAAVWIAVAFFGVYRFLAYIDRRIRLEGWELDLRLKAAAHGLEANAG
jgi:hypothetical protein